MIAWGSRGAALTTMLCWAWVAAFQLPLPAWFASMRQVPALVKLTTPLAMEHPVEEASRVIAAVRPLVALAVGV